MDRTPLTYPSYAMSPVSYPGDFGFDLSYLYDLIHPHYPFYPIHLSYLPLSTLPFYYTG